LTLPSFVYEEQSIWILIFAFYLADQVKLLGEDELLLQQTFRLGCAAKIARVPFVVLGRHLYVLDFFAPHALAGKASWSAGAATDARGLCRATREIALLDKRVTGIRAVGVSAFVVYFMVGPAVTHLYGLTQAVFLVLPLHGLLVAGLFAVQAISRRPLKLPWRQVVGLTLECALCPGYLPNAVRRISWPRRLAADGAIFSLSRLDAERRERFRAALESRMEEPA